jgi:anthranilate synthase/phosphoribosyltransferase
MIAVIDNYDSFTYNVVQSLQRLSGDQVAVLRSGECTTGDIENLKPDYLVISPGPGRPADAGISEKAILHFAGKIPILGICLGHQAIGEAFGSKIIQAKYIRHGIVEEMDLDGRGLFRTIGKTGKFTRYHSLVIDEKTLPPEFEVTARAKDGDIMGIRHKTLPIEGIQFHPESIASEDGDKIFTAFLNYRRENLPVSEILNRLIAKKDLDEKTAALFMENLTDGTLDERQTAAILVALAAKGPSAGEMAGCASVLCRKKRKVPIDSTGLAEIVGTGGDGKGSFNISSLSALTAAACGLPVAKHGNRAVSSKSGAADFYESLGIKIDTTPEKTAALIKKTGFGFLMAPIYHSAMRFAGPVRKALGVKTIMNVLGPLTNPAGAQYEMLGVYDVSLLQPVAEAAKKLGAVRVMVISSRDGYDEISPCAPTYAYMIDENNKVTKATIRPEDFGITGCSEKELAGGTGRENALLALDILSGKGRKTLREAVGLNTAAVLYTAKKVPDLQSGYKMAISAIENGTVLAKLEEVKKESNAV